MGRWKGVVSLRVLLGIVVLAGVGRLPALPPTGKQFDSKLFQELRWRSVGPPRGGRVLAVSGVRGQPEVYYFGAVGGGVWRTNDAGRTWNPIFDATGIASIGAIAVAPSKPEVIYVGTGEADMRASISLGNGVYRSSDGGKTWAHVGLSESRHIGRILVDPHDAEKVYVAALGHAYGPNAERGVFRSKDGGKTWQRVLFKDQNTGAIDLAFEPGNPETLYAALWQTRRPPWSIYAPSNGPGSGLYRSRDSGEHWELVQGQGLPSEGLGRIGIAFAPGNAKRIYLVVDAKDGGIFRSDDGGASWKRVANDKRLWQRGWYFGEISVDPKDPDTVYALNTAAYVSHDGGATFHAWKGAPGGDDYHELWIDPDEPRRMILSCDQGAIVTRNGGETWSSWLNQPTAQFYHVSTDERFPYWIYGAQQDSGAALVPSRSKYLSLNMHDWRPLDAGDENGYIAPDPQNPELVYGGFVMRQDLDNEQEQHMVPTLAHAGEFRRTWTLPLAFSLRDPRVLYFGSQVLFRTADGGNSWQIISPDLTRENPGMPENLDAATAADGPKGERRGVIYTIAPSGLRGGEIWAGTDDGLIQLTEDEGKTWKNVTPAEIKPWSKVTLIEASHFEAGTAYAAVDRHRLEDLNAYLYRTRDFGKSWQRLSRGIPEGSFLNCVREDPVRRGLLYACTEKGVYVSFDDGEEWQPLQLNLPATSVRDLVVHEDDLVIATFGRSFWILDDVTPLRQLDAQVAASDSWLFRPRTTYRVRPGTDEGTPVSTDEPLAANPPNGAVLNYYLKEQATSPIQLEVFDSGGRLVRRFASDAKLDKTDPDSVHYTANWIEDPVALSAEAGMHRFVWDLRIELPKGVYRNEMLEHGPMVAPGEYTVKLTVNSKTLAQPLSVKPDPRVKTTPEGLARQYELASRVTARAGQVAAGLRQAGDLQKQVEARIKEATGKTELLKSLEELNQKIEAPGMIDFDADYGLFGLALPKEGRETLPDVSSALLRLLVILESGDVAPTADVAKSAERWDAEAGKALERWRVLSTQDCARINSLLQKEKLAPLSVK
ncbi:MAG TPA: hypothetical protein VED66_08780 [Candidatus Sulfotelmatobacter sp.]|nr:hypothetical protein [Candidatus Sulfotelmatobacter sp.]